MSEFEALRSQLSEIDRFIQAGSFNRARRALAPLFKQKIPREFVLTLASLARRAFMADRSVKLLNRIVRSSSRSQATPATEFEKAEYAAALDFIGANTEAIALLQQLDGSKNNLVHLFLAFALIRQWDWKAAIPQLERYIAHPRSNPAQVAAGKLYLASSLQHADEKLDRAETLLQEVAQTSESDPMGFLHKNSMLLILKNQILQKHFQETPKTIAAIEKRCLEQRDVYFLTLFYKWRCIQELIQNHDSKKDTVPTQKKLTLIRDRLMDLKVWERARACDYYAASILNDSERWIRLHYGSPYPPLRAEIEKHIQGAQNLPPTLIWSVGDPRGKPFEFDIGNGSNSLTDRLRLKEGQLPQRTLQALCADFYRPPRLAELHLRLYPAVPYNPVFSPDKIHHAMQRLRLWLQRYKLPLRIREKQGEYRIESSSACKLTITRLENPEASTKIQLYTHQLKKHFDEKSFNAREAAEALKISDRSSVRHLKDACDHGLLQKSGRGPSTRYWVNASSSSPKSKPLL